jgi:hypothetical protein
MKEDAILKKSLFGGFNKKDVLALIEKIQTDHIDDSEALKNKDLELEAIKDEAAKLEDRLEAEKKRFSALASLNDDYCERIYELEEEIRTQSAEIEGIKEDFGRLKKVESQIGSLLVDAVLYSDRVTERAKSTADSITSNAKQSLSSTAIDVCKLSQDIAKVSAEFSSEISVVVNKVDALSKTLNELTQTFISKVEEENFERYDATQAVETFLAETEDAAETDDLSEEIVDEPLQDDASDYVEESENEIGDEITAENEDAVVDILSEDHDLTEEHAELVEDAGDYAESDEEVPDLDDAYSSDEEGEEESDETLSRENDSEEFELEGEEPDSNDETEDVDSELEFDDSDLLEPESDDFEVEVEVEAKDVVADADAVTEEDLESKHEANFSFADEDSSSVSEEAPMVEEAGDKSESIKGTIISQADIEELLRVFSEFDN